MAPRQAPLDGILTLKQPVHGGVKIVLVDLPEPQRLGEGVARGVRRQAPGGRQLGTRIENAGDDHRQHASALGRVRAGDRAVQAQFAQRPEHGGDMAVRKGALDVEGVVEAGATAAPPLSSTRKPSMSVGGHLERLARVRLLTLPASRKDSRRSTAGGELRLGTLSMYMATECERQRSNESI